jgi:hypothetical protein
MALLLELIYQFFLTQNPLMCNIQKTWLTFFVAAQLALIFAHTEKYPDEPPLLNVSRSVSIYYYLLLFVCPVYVKFIK